MKKVALTAIKEKMKKIGLEENERKKGKNWP